MGPISHGSHPPFLLVLMAPLSLTATSSSKDGGLLIALRAGRTILVDVIPSSRPAAGDPRSGDAQPRRAGPAAVAPRGHRLRGPGPGGGCSLAHGHGRPADRLCFPSGGRSLLPGGLR